MRTVTIVVAALLVTAGGAAAQVAGTRSTTPPAGTRPTPTAPAGARATGTAPAGALPTAAAPGAQLPNAWLGIAFRCTDCVYTRASGQQRGAAAGRWTFRTPPEVYSVEPGSPAHAAGIRRGDVLTHVDDQPITSEAGGLRWAQVRPGEKVRLRYRRASSVRYATVQAAAPPGIAATAIRPGQAPVQLQRLEAALARADSASTQLQQAAARARQEQARQEEVLRALQAAQQARLAELEAVLQAAETIESRRHAEELLRALARDQEQLQQRQQRQVQELVRSNLRQAERLAASRDSIGRAVTALSNVYAASVNAEQRVRYSGTFGGSDIEVRSVIPVVVTETATEVTIRAGDTVVTLKRTR